MEWRETIVDGYDRLPEVMKEERLGQDDDDVRIGLTVPTPGEKPDLATFLTGIERAEAPGLHKIRMPDVSSRGFDALTALALAGTRTRGVEPEPVLRPR